MNTTTKDTETIRNAGRQAAQEAFDQLPSTEPERSRFADPTFPEAWEENDRQMLADDLGREPTDDEMSQYIAAWEERYEELMVEKA